MNVFFISAWRSGLRGHSFHAVFALGVLLIGCAYLAALFSPRQPETVALDVGFSGLRFALLLLSLSWVQELVGKEIERRTAILYLAYPLHRAHYVLGRFLGIIGLLLIAAAILGLLLWLAVFSAGEEYAQAHRGALGIPFWSTVFGLWLDMVVVTAFAVCIATLSTTPALPLALGAAFAIAGHSLGAVVEYLARGADGRQDLVTHYGSVVELSRWVLPDLSRLDWRAWPMYDLPAPAGAIGLACLMALSYAIIMLLFAVEIFKRREFD